MAKKLVELGYEPETKETEEYIARWHGADVQTIRDGQSADYLRRSNQLEDLDFVLSHIDDLDTVPCMVDGELVGARVENSKAYALAPLRAAVGSR